MAGTKKKPTAVTKPIDGPSPSPIGKSTPRRRQPNATKTSNEVNIVVNSLKSTDSVTPAHDTNPSQLMQPTSATVNKSRESSSPLSEQYGTDFAIVKPSIVPLTTSSVAISRYHSPTEINRSLVLPSSSSPGNVVSCEEVLCLLEKAIGPALAPIPHRYTSATVLLLSWQEDAKNFKAGLIDLGKAFEHKFGFSVKEFGIPCDRSRPLLHHTIIDCLKTRDAGGSLLIVCYAGHSTVLSEAQTVLHSSNGLATGINMLDLHQMIMSYESDSDIVYLMDIHCAGFYPSESAHCKVKGEVLCAGSWSGKRKELSTNDFTQALAIELGSLATDTSITVAELHNRLSRRAAKTASFAADPPYHTMFGRRPISSIVLEAIVANQSTTIEDVVMSDKDLSIGPAEALNPRRHLTEEMLMPLIQVSIELVESAAESYRRWNAWRENVHREDDPSVLSLATLHVRDLYIMESVHTGNSPGGCIWTLNMPKFIFDNGLADLKYVKFLRVLNSPNLLPTTGSQRLAKPYSPLDRAEIEDPLLSDWSTVTQANWWAAEDGVMLSETYRRGEFRDITRFVEDKTSHAWSLARFDRLAEAERLCQDAVTKFEKEQIWVEPNHPYVLNAFKNLALLQSQQKGSDKLTDAMQTFEELRRRCITAYGDKTHWVEHVDYHIAILTGQLGDLEKARDMFNSLLWTMKNGSVSYFDPRRFSCMYQVAVTHHQLHEYALAEEQYMHLITCFTEAHGQHHALVTAASTGLAHVLRSQGKDLAAEIVSSSVSRLLSKDLIGNPQPLPQAWSSDV